MAASSSSSAGGIPSTSYVDVNIWLAKDEHGKTTTSSEGGRLGRNARCGHVSMEICPKDKESVYVSFWPSNSDHSSEGKRVGYGKLCPPRVGVLVPNLENDIFNESGLPDVIIRLHELDIPTMLQRFNLLKARVDRQEIMWELIVSSNTHVTSGATKASCATFVWNLLKTGGICRADSKGELVITPYTGHIRKTGPSDREFYKITKCNAGDRFWGWFNFAPWVERFFSPKALLLHVASVASVVPLDKQETTRIMASNRVATELEDGGLPSATNVALTVLAAGALTYAFQAKK